MILDENASFIISLLIASGHKAYAVGGCIRDSIMNREIGDVDITTSAKPDELESILNKKNIKFYETGIKHGTITALINDCSYEITTFRTDGSYIDNRHPESVKYINSLEDDLARRDFTMNAIAYNEEAGIIDIFGGKGDIEKNIIRTVGDPDKRFKEDALRIMRAIRFASVLGFDIEYKTKEALFRNKKLLNNVSSERIYIEFIKLIMGDNAERVLIDYRDIIAVIIPEIKVIFDYPQNCKWHIYDVYTHSVKSVAVSPKKDYIRLAMFLHDIGKPYCRTVGKSGQDHFKGHPKVSCELSDKILKRFKVSNDIYNNVMKLIEIHDLFITNDKADIKHWLNAIGDKLTFDYIDVKIADLKTHNPMFTRKEIKNLYEIRKIADKILLDNEPYRLSDLAIDGDDLKGKGYEGPAIGLKLNELVNIVIDNPEENNRDSLLRYL